MNIKDWKNRELEKLYINVFILEEEAYVRIKEEIKKKKIYIFIGVNLRGYKEILSVQVPEEETTGYWIRELTKIKERGVEELFMVSMINNKWIKKVVKMIYPDTIYAPSLVEIYNKTCNYIKRIDHRIVMRELSRIYKADTIEEAKEKYKNLKEIYKDNKLLNLIIDKYIEDIFAMFKYSKEARRITSNTDSYNKMRNRIRWRIKKQDLYENEKEMYEKLYEILKEEENRWHPSVKNWDKIINEMDCNLSEKILELI